MSVSQAELTPVIRVSAEASTPEDARDLADAWVYALSAEVAELEGGEADGASSLTLIPIEAAALPTRPISPNVELGVVLGLLVGAVAGVLYALIRNQSDKKLRTIEALRRATNSSVLGAVPTGDVTSALTGREDRSNAPTLEAFRRIRTNLRFMNVDDPPRVIVVTSALPGEGKSAVAANIAIAIAESGQRAIIVDADLRRPTVADRFGLVEGAGLTDVLVHAAEIDDVIQIWPHSQNLAVLPAGSAPPNPSELLGSDVMHDLLMELKEHAFVIIDSPPLLPVTDAAVLTARVDGAVLVARAGVTTIDQVTAAAEDLEAANGRLLGTVLNAVSKKSTGYQGGYYGAYYGGYYGSTDGQGQSLTPAGTKRQRLGRDASAVGDSASAGASPSSAEPSAAAPATQEPPVSPVAHAPASYPPASAPAASGDHAVQWKPVTPSGEAVSTTRTRRDR